MPPGSYRYACEPAATIIRALGGVRAVAIALGVSPEYVSKWNRPALRGGTGGFIPEIRRKGIYLLARKLGVKAITKKLLNSGSREVIPVGKASKIKGDRFEFQVVRELNEAGFEAHRVPLSGAVKGYPGDVNVKAPSGTWILQCKINSRQNESGRTAVIKLLHDVVIGRVSTEKGVYFAMQRDVFLGWMRGEVPSVVNMPLMKTKGTQIADAIEGHDALVFRRDGVTAWYALVREGKFPGAR